MSILRDSPLVQALARSPAPSAPPRPSRGPSVFSGPLSSSPFAEAVRQSTLRATAAHAVLAAHEQRPAPQPVAARPDVKALMEAIAAQTSRGPTAPLQRAPIAGQSLQELDTLAHTGRMGREAQAHDVEEARRRAEAGAAVDPFGVVNLTPLVEAAAHVKLPGLGGVVGKLANELVDLPGQTFLSSEMAGAAAKEALEGHLKPGSVLLHSIEQQVTHPLRSFEQAPIGTALTFAGGEDALGRIAGGLMRNLPIDALKDLATTERPDLELYGQNPDGSPVAKEQTYNPDPLRKAAQVAYEKALTKLPEPLRQRDPFLAEGWRLERELVGGRVKPGRIDREVAADEAARRQLVKNKVVAQAVEAGSSGKRLGGVLGVRPIEGQDAVHLLVDGTIRPGSIEEDLLKRETVLQDARDSGLLKQRELKANAQSLKEVRGLLADKRFLADPSEAIAAAKRVVQLQKPLTALRVVHGDLTEEQAARAPLEPYALSHMGARHFSIEDHAAVEQEALNVERGAQARLDAAKPDSPEAEEARQELVAARARRLEVSGREGGPEAVLAHEQATADHVETQQRVREAQRDLEQAEHARSRLVGARAAARPRQDLAVEGLGDRMAAADAKVLGAKEALHAAREADADALERAQHSPLPPIRAAIRNADGTPLSNEEIRADMAEHGVEDVGFSSHKPGRTAAGSYYKSLLRKPSLERFARTGAAYLKGTNDHSFEGLVRHLADEASKVAQHEAQAARITRYGIGEYASLADARDAADNFNDPQSTLPGAREARQLGGMRVVSKGAAQIIERGELKTAADVKDALARLGLEEHTPASSFDQGKYTLVPEDIMRRFEAHDDATAAHTDWKRFLQAYTGAFRHVKFALSPHHIAGITQENILRPIFESAGPLSYLGASRFTRALGDMAETDEHGTLLDEFGPEGRQARQVQGLLAGRGLVTATKATDIVRKPDQFDERDVMTTAAEKAGRSVPVKAWLLWRNGTERLLRGVEHVSQTAQLGKVLTRSGLLDSAWQAARMTDEGMRELLEDRLTPNKADAIARALDNAAGNWNHLTPGVRASVSTVTPFGLWLVNSYHWLAHLPIEHPLHTAVLAALYDATRRQRNEIGQGYQAPGVGTEAHPDYKQGTIQIPGVGSLDLGHYSPMGVAGPEATNTAAEMVLPQLSGVLSALKGENTLTGRPLTQTANDYGPELTAGQKALNALSELLSGPTAGATQAQELLEHGGKPLGTSNLFTDLAHALGVGPAQTEAGTNKPETSTLLKILEPLRIYREASAPKLTPAALEQKVEKDEERVQNSAALQLSPEAERTLSAAEKAIAARIAAE